jgi:glycosyltransferase involved in cell wall biosynthesis
MPLWVLRHPRARPLVVLARIRFPLELRQGRQADQSPRRLSRHPADPPAPRVRKDGARRQAKLVGLVASWSLHEALATGCVVIASDTQTAREFVTHERNGLLVSFFEPEALADTVLHVLEDRHWRGACGRARGITPRKRWQWRITSRRTRS